MSLRQDYGLPARPPITLRVLAVHLAVLVAAFGLWLAVPGTATVAILTLVVLGIVFSGVYRVMSSRDLEEPPGRHPEPPPSA
jgi:hypothetical protein